MNSGAIRALYFAVFCYMGVFLPWFPPYFASVGLGPAEIGVALAIVSLARVTFPPVWGVVTDRFGGERALLGVSAGISALAAASIHWLDSPSTLIVAMAVHGFFLVPVIPLADTLTLSHLAGRGERYGRFRLWGSIGFVASSVGFGLVATRIGLSPVPFAAAAPLAFATIVAARLPRRERSLRAPRDVGSPGPDGVARKEEMPWKALVLVVAAAALGQASHGPYYAFFSIELSSAGVDAASIGALWSWGVAAEVLLMALSPRLLARIGLESGMRWGLGLATLRWLLYATEPGLPLLVAGQALHAASFGLLHVSAIQLVARITPASRRSFGQSILSAYAYALGIGGGLLFAGLAADHIGMRGLYVAAALASVSGLALASRLAPRARSGSDSVS